jgi:hypothetical protein
MIDTLKIVIVAVLLSSAGATATQPPVEGDNFIVTENFATMPMPAGTLDDAIGIALEIDSGAASDLSAAINDGSVKVVEIWRSSPIGAHDSDTIGVKRGVSSEVAAVTLLHEWEHVEHCDPGDDGDSRRTDFCYDCIHAGMTSNTRNQLRAAICTKIYDLGEEDQRAADCAEQAALDDPTDSVNSNTCSLGCGVSVATPAVPVCPNCD